MVLKNKLNVQTWTSRPVLSIAELQPMSLTNYGLEAQRYPIPVIVKRSKDDPYLSPRLHSIETFPSTIELQQYLSDEHQIIGTRGWSPTFTRTVMTIMISYETSKSSVLVLAFTLLAMAVLVGVIAGVLSKKSGIGFAVTSGLVAIMAAIQSFYRQ